jgi:N-acetylmuramoyl-L-alanine amidase
LGNGEDFQASVWLPPPQTKPLTASSTIKPQQIPLMNKYSITLCTFAFAALTMFGASSAPGPSLRELQRVEQKLIPKDKAWRLPTRTMAPQFITVHSTDNEKAGADAAAHDALLSVHGFPSLLRDKKGNPLMDKNGKPQRNPLSRMGFITWHFTVDENRAIQHLPVSEQGDHADFTGPGNQVSIGVEICVNAGADRERTTLRAAAVVARLMKENNLTIDKVVPHYHWPQPPRSFQKPCPSIFMDGGKPGKTWLRFLQQVQQFRDQS